MNNATVEWLDTLNAADAHQQFLKTCGSRWWCDRMIEQRPYGTPEKLQKAAETAFDAMPREAWLEAFASHPRVGDLDSLRMKFAGNREWSGQEQAGAVGAEEAVLQQLAEANETYYRRFGWIFIVCATGKSAAEMLTLLRDRLKSPPGLELETAANEQRKITRLRLEKLEPNATA